MAQAFLLTDNQLYMQTAECGVIYELVIFNYPFVFQIYFAAYFVLLIITSLSFHIVL